MKSGRRWTINGRFLAQPLTGVQRYAREIVLALDEKLAGEHPLAANLALDVAAPPSAVDDLQLKRIPIRKAGRLDGHLWEQVELPRHAPGGIVSLCNVGPLAAGRHVVCIHDANTWLAPSSYSWHFRSLYRVLLPALSTRAACVTTVSHFSARELARLHIAPAARIRVIPNGHEHTRRWTAQHGAATRAVCGPNTIVVIGSPAPHKNLAMLLGLADGLAAEGLSLAIVGSLDQRVFASEIPAASAHNVRWLGRLTDSEISALLRDCLCLAFPSFVEGFGLPPLEAMSVGCPVVVSDRSSLPEICGTAALYAPPDAPGRWLEQFRLLKNNPVLGEQMRQRGKVSAARFSWMCSAESYLEVLAEIDGVSGSAPAGNRAGDRAAAPAVEASA